MAVLIFAGDVKAKRAFELAEKTFGNWKVSTPLPKIDLAQLENPEKTQIYLVDRPGSIQSQIRIGQLGITRHNNGYFVSRVVSNYFGWAFNSRLNKSIRVAKGLTYGIWGSFIAHRFAGDFKVSTFSKTESTAQTVQAILDEIQRLQAEPPTTEELETSRSYLLGSFPRHRETPQQNAEDLWLIGSQQLGADYLERFLAGVADTDTQDCQRLVQNTIDPSKMVIIVVGQADELKDELEKIASVIVVTKEPAN